MMDYVKSADSVKVLSSVSFGSWYMIIMVIDGSRKKPSRLLNFVNYSSRVRKIRNEDS